MMGSKRCLCGCGGIIFEDSYLEGHDVKHRDKLVQRGGGAERLEKTLAVIDAYINGEINESEMARSIRRLRMKG